MQNLLPPAPLSLIGDRRENWKKWHRRWTLFCTACGLDKETEEVRTATLLTVIGEEGYDIYDTFKWSDDADSTKLDCILKKFEEYFIPKSNVTLERHVFNSRSQLENESTEDYVQILKQLIKSCQYGDLTDSILRDRIITGISDDKLRMRLLEKSDMDLEQTMGIVKATEASKSHVNRLGKLQTEESTLHVDKVAAFRSKAGFGNLADNNKKQFQKGYTPKKQTGYKHYHKDKGCGFCGTTHAPKSCPAFGQTCHKCKGRNHFARVCRKGKHKNSKHVSLVGTEDCSSQDDVFYIGAVTKDAATNSDWTDTLVINNVEVKFKLDTGAQCNILPQKLYKLVSDKPLQKTQVKLKSYTKNVLQPVGQAQLTCKWKGTKYRINFQIVSGNYEAILGNETLEKMRMIIRNIHGVKEITTQAAKVAQATQEENIFTEFKDLFEGLGKLPGAYKIKIDGTVQPVVHPPRNVPHALKQKVEEELKKMTEMQIIEKVPHNEPTEWVHSLVTVPKPNGEVRLCLDPRDLNKAIKREHHPITTINEVAAKVVGARYFTLLDARSAFFQIVLDSESSKLLTFNTPFGRFKYLRMPMGIKSATEVYQRRIQEVLEGIEGVEAGIDDVLVWGDTEKSHDERLRQVLVRLRENNLKLKKEKCKIKRQEIKFHGHMFTTEGLQPDNSKCIAIRDMPLPTKKDEVKTFLGMVTYVSKFIPNLSELSGPLRELLHKDTEWHWNAKHTKCFQKLKDTLSNPPVLAYYDPKKPLILQVDASSRGMGAALIQEGRPVAFASKALTQTQQQYSQIEKEMLAIVFGCTKFENFIIGRDVIIESDHKPLEMITNKPLFTAPPRLQRMLLQLQRYPGIQVKYTKGSQIQIADALSRAFVDDNLNMEEMYVNAIEIIPISETKLKEIQEVTDKDRELTALKQLILTGWPNKKCETDVITHEYWNTRDELTIIDGLIFKGSRLLIPKTLRKEMLEKLHRSHMGMVKTKQRAREVLYWPRLNNDIEELVRSCDLCAEHQNANCRETLISHEIPDRPWSKVACDLFSFKGNCYVICVDFFSKYPEVSLLQSTTSASVVISLKSIFARHGIPDILFTDNGPQYASKEFQTFCNQWEIIHQTSSPTYPQSNGQVERMVQTVKKMLKKATDPYIAILEYRNTPIEDIGASPAQLLMSRRLRSVLPMTSKMLKPEIQENAQEKLKLRQDRQKTVYDRSAKNLPELHVGQEIRFKQGTWKKATVTEQLPFRSYIVQNENFQRYRRNRRDLRSQTENRKDQRPHTAQETRMEHNNPTAVSEEGSRELDIRKSRTGRIIKTPNRLDL